MTPYDNYAEKVTLLAHNRMWVHAELGPDGGLAFVGQDLNPDNPYRAEYEYVITVDPDDVPRVVAAVWDLVGRDAGDDIDILALLRIHRNEIIRAGEHAVLKRHGVPFRFHDRVGEPLTPEEPTPDG